MSTRLLMNLALATVALLLLASLGVVVTSLGDRDSQNTQVDLALQQQALIQDLNQETVNLAAADNLLSVNQARGRLGDKVVDFDQGLAALVKGGTLDRHDGTMAHISPVKNEDARVALEEAARLWIDTGLPLADLAAGEYSIFSAAGQQAAANLTANSPALANQMGIAAAALQVKNQSQSSRAGLARYAVVACGLLLGGLLIARFKPIKAPAPAPASTAPRAMARPTASHSAGSPSVEDPRPAGPMEAPVQTMDWSRHSGQTFSSPVDFDTVNASVDQMSVDMNTIAGSTDKMRTAIDSVGHALQGMLYSLNEMAQDTAEGYKIVRGANNAASYTASTANELAASAREMSRVVARVTQLAMKTKQVAAQIDAEAVSTGTTGEKFTSVVAAEVQGLSRQTSAATQEIENTVAEILGTARQYEEAIGQIIKNISAINKVSENLGELMLHPPAAGVAGTPLPIPQSHSLGHQAAPAPQAAPVAEAPAPGPAPAAEAPQAPTPEPAQNFQDEVVAEPTVTEVAEQTSSAIEKAADEVAEEAPAAPGPAGSTGNVFMLGGGPRKPRMDLKIPKPEADEPKAEEPKPAPEEAPQEDEGTNIFMLNKPKKAPAAAPEPPKAEEPAPAPAPTPEPAPAAAEPAAEEKEESGGNIFMLNKPKKAPAAAPESPKAEEPAPAPAPTPEPAPAAAEPAAEEEDTGSNIFMLNKPKKAPAAAPAEAPPEASAEPEPPASEEPVAEEEEPVTVPADDEKPAEDKGSNGNIFMLNKPKK
jgi:hypothetical protein